MCIRDRSKASLVRKGDGTPRAEDGPPHGDGLVVRPRQKARSPRPRCFEPEALSPWAGPWKKARHLLDEEHVAWGPPWASDHAFRSTVRSERGKRRRCQRWRRRSPL